MTAEDNNRMALHLDLITWEDHLKSLFTEPINTLKWSPSDKGQKPFTSHDIIPDNTWTQEPIIHEDIQPDHFVEG